MSAAAPYLTCREVIGFLADYLDGVLSPAQVTELERHLAVCPSCVAYVATYRQAIRMAHLAVSAPELRVEDVPEELLRAILAAR